MEKLIVFFWAIMETLDHLVSKGILDKNLRPITPKTPVKVVKNGVIFQQQCHNGLPYDIAISWLQKAIRRGQKEQALYCAFHIGSLGKMFQNHLLNRLITVLSEDIGPAEPGLAVLIEDLYCKAKCNDQDEARISVITMVSLLSDSRKSRITDWLIHINEDLSINEPDCDMSEGLDQMLQWAIYLSKNRIQEDEQIPVKYERRGVIYQTAKKLAVYHVWNLMLEVTTTNIKIYDEIVALMRLFTIRGPIYGLLHLIHAVTLIYMGNEMAVPSLPNVIPKWSELSVLDFPVMNAAVDMHTRHGRQLLGRGRTEFMHDGSKLENWTPFPNEKEIIKKLIDELEPAEVEDSEPRKYQENIITQAVQHLKVHRTGWLLMACGTGKTKTSYWTMKQVLNNNGNTGTIVVVTPYLQILRQFHSSWAAMNRLYKLKSITGILASCSDSNSKDDYTNYEYLKEERDINKFMSYPDNVKFIFTTYTSLHKLLKMGVEPMLTVYDEAHHVKEHKMFGIGQELFLTATPHQVHSGEVIANYNLRNAINDGFLTPYEVFILQTSDIEGLVYALNSSKKCIVYCATNMAAREFYQAWLETGATEETSFYIDCKIGKRERQRIFKAYREAKKAVIFNCAILGEGVDFTDCDSIFIHSGYVSETRVVQAMGRPLRLMKGKKLARIFIIDDDKVQKRIAAMAKYDPVVEEHLSWVY